MIAAANTSCSCRGALCATQQGCTGCISPHPSLGCLVSSSLAAHQARRPAGVSSASSRHGVGYSTAISDSERRIFCQHSDHDSGGGELGWQADRKAAPARRGFDLKCGDVRDVAGEQARCILAPLHRPMLARDFTVANSSQTSTEATTRCHLTSHLRHC